MSDDFNDPPKFKKGAGTVTKLKPWQRLDENGIMRADKGRCWNGIPELGCEQFHDPKDYNHPLRLCIKCCNRIAAKWRIDFEDLSFLMTALTVLQGHGITAEGRPERAATPDQVYTCLAKMGISPRDRPRTKVGEDMPELSHVWRQR
jgi:hypothetical protein